MIPLTIYSSEDQILKRISKRAQKKGRSQLVKITIDTRETKSTNSANNNNNNNSNNKLKNGQNAN